MYYERQTIGDFVGGVLDGFNQTELMSPLVPNNEEKRCKPGVPGPNMRGLTKPPPPSFLELNRTSEGDAMPVAL